MESMKIIGVAVTIMPREITEKIGKKLINFVDALKKYEGNG